MEQLSTPLRVDLDLPVTRRNRVHEVRDAQDVPVFYAREISAVFAWLCDNEVNQVTVHDVDLDFIITVHRLTVDDPKPKG